MAGAGMKTAAERKRDERRRMRAAGFVLRQLWVHPLDWPAVRAYVERKRKERHRRNGPLGYVAADEGMRRREEEMRRKVGGGCISKGPV